MWVTDWHDHNGTDVKTQGGEDEESEQCAIMPGVKINSSFILSS